MDVVVWALLGYAAGVVPSAFLVAVLTGRVALLDGVRRDAGEHDAHVVLKEAGAGRAVTVAAVLDVLKAFVPTLVAAMTAAPQAAAACGVGAVTGHCWPPAWRRFAGRGLAAAAGAFLALLPVEMAFGGAVTVTGIALRFGGLASTVGFVAVPLLASARGQPGAYVFMAWMVNALVVARRLEGVSRDIAAGAVPVWAVARRVFLDASQEGRNRGPGELSN